MYVLLTCTSLSVLNKLSKRYLQKDIYFLKIGTCTEDVSVNFEEIPEIE